VCLQGGDDTVFFGLLKAGDHRADEALRQTIPLRGDRSDILRPRVRPALLDFEAALARGRSQSRSDSPPPTPRSLPLPAARSNSTLKNLAPRLRFPANVAIPLIKKLTELIAKQNKDAARFVHWGATSQDAMDTGLILQLRRALEVVDQDLARLTFTLATLADKPTALLLSPRAPGCSRPFRPHSVSSLPVGWTHSPPSRAPRGIARSQFDIAIRWSRRHVGRPLKPWAGGCQSAGGRVCVYSCPRFHGTRTAIASQRSPQPSVFASGRWAKSRATFRCTPQTENRGNRRASRGGPRRLFHHAAKTQPP